MTKSGEINAELGWVRCSIGNTETKETGYNEMVSLTVDI